MDDAALQGALECAELGVRVFPVFGVRDGACICPDGPSCDNPGKHPMERGWQAAASVKPRRIDAWARTYPGCNWGLITADLVVVDVDPRNGGELDTLPAWLPQTTWRVATGGGGWHLGYAPPADVAVSGGKLQQGVDLKGKGGYVVAPGSMHAAGRRYEWVASRPTQAPPTWPLQVADRERPAAMDTAERSRLADLLHNAPQHEGEGRNEWLTQVAGHLAKTVPYEDAYRALLVSINDTIEQPLSRAELDKITASIWHAEEAKAATEDDADPSWNRDVAQAARRLRVQEEARRVARRAILVEPPTTLPGAEYLALPDDEQTWAIEGLLQMGGNALLAAAFKVGKTTLLLNLLRAACEGHPFLQRFDVTLEPGRRIGFFNYELPPGQFRAWVKALGITHPDRFAILDLRGHNMRLGEETVDAWVTAWLAQWNIDMWVLDPFARAYGGQSENDNTEVAAWTDAVDAIKDRAGVRNCVVGAHFGREQFDEGGEHVRGATRLDDWADARWIMTRDAADERYFSATGRDVEVKQGRILYDGQHRTMTMVQGGKATRRLERIEELVLAYLNKHTDGLSGPAIRPALTSKAIEKQVEGRAMDVRRTLHKLVEDDAVAIVNGPHGERWHYPSAHPDAQKGLFDES